MIDLDKRYIVPVLAFLVFFGLSVFAGIHELIEAFSSVKVLPIFIALALTVVGYLARYGKWELYLRHLDVRADMKTSLEIFFSGLMMVVTPGKMGEIWKAWLMEEREGIPKDTTFAVVTAERLTDLIALFAFSILGLFVYSGSKIMIYVSAILILAVILFIKSEKLMLAVLKIFENIPIIGSYAEEFESFYLSSNKLFDIKSFAPAMGLSLFAWGMEGISLYILAGSVGFEISIYSAFFIFGFSSVIGALSMLPGGLGATEISMTGLMISLGIPKTEAVTLTILIRATTLWFGALTGFIVYHFSNLRSDFRTLDE